MKKLAGYFLRGLLFLAPPAATVYVLYKLFRIIDGLLPFTVPTGVGFVLIFILITAMGYASTLYFANPLLLFLERSIEKTPLVKLIYTSVKDLVAAFVGEKRRFNHPVLVTLNKETGLSRVGFITQNDLSELGISKEKIVVYLPFSYSFAGTLIIVSKENVIPIDASGTDMMKFVISGGVTGL